MSILFLIKENIFIPHHPSLIKKVEKKTGHANFSLRCPSSWNTWQINSMRKATRISWSSGRSCPY
jgi:hypothetical protein